MLTRPSASAGGLGHWFPGRIDRVNDDGTFAVTYDDGDTEGDVTRERLRPRATDAPADPAVGTVVADGEARTIVIAMLGLDGGGKTTLLEVLQVRGVARGGGMETARVDSHARPRLAVPPGRAGT